MKNKFTGIIIGILIGALTMGSVIYANPELLFNSVNIEVNGSKVAEKNQNYTLSDGTEVPFSIVYNGTTYLPFRKLGELMNKEIGWDAETETAYCFDTQSNPSGVAFYLDNFVDFYNNYVSILLDLVDDYYTLGLKEDTADYLQKFNDQLYNYNTEYNEGKKYILNNTTNPDFIKTTEILDQMQTIVNEAQKLATNLCLAYDVTNSEKLHELKLNIADLAINTIPLLSKYKTLSLNENISNVNTAEDNAEGNDSGVAFFLYFIADKYMDTISDINGELTDYIVAKYYEDTTLMDNAEENIKEAITSLTDYNKNFTETKQLLKNNATFISALTKLEKLKECSDNVTSLAMDLIHSYDVDKNSKLSNNVELAITYYYNIEDELFDYATLY